MAGGKKPTAEQEFHSNRRRRKLLCGVAAMLRASEGGGVGLGCLRATCGGGGGAKQGQGRFPAAAAAQNNGERWRGRQPCFCAEEEELWVDLDAKRKEARGFSVNT